MTRKLRTLGFTPFLLTAFQLLLAGAAVRVGQGSSGTIHAPALRASHTRENPPRLAPSQTIPRYIITTPLPAPPAAPAIRDFAVADAAPTAARDGLPTRFVHDLPQPRGPPASV
jgi:hypothetical protein